MPNVHNCTISGLKSRKPCHKNFLLLSIDSNISPLRAIVKQIGEFLSKLNNAMMTILSTIIRPISCNYWILMSCMTLIYATPFYAFVLIVLFRNRKSQNFNSIFYRIVFIMGIVDLLYIIHYYALVKLPAVGAFFDFYVRFARVPPYNETGRYSILNYVYRISSNRAPWGRYCFK